MSIALHPRATYGNPDPDEYEEERERISAIDRENEEIDRQNAASIVAAADFGKTNLCKLIQSNPVLHPYVINRLLRLGEIMNLVGAPKSNKSWFAKYIAICVATGIPLLSEFNCTAGRVLYLDNELHAATLADRFRTILRAMRIEVADVSPNLMVETMRGNLADLHRVQQLMASIPPGTIKLLVLDAAYRFAIDGTEENSNDGQKLFYNLLDKIAKDQGCAIIAIHHSTKGNQSGKSNTDMGAGGGAQSRAADSHCSIREHEEPGILVFNASLRSSAPLDPFCMEFKHPLWSIATGYDASQLKRDYSKSGRPRGVRIEKEAPHVWTAEEFAKAFITNEPRPRALIIAKANQSGMGQNTAERLLTLCFDERFEFKHKISGDTKAYYANREPTLMDELTMCHAPLVPPHTHDTSSVMRETGFHDTEIVTTKKPRGKRTAAENR